MISKMRIGELAERTGLTPRTIRYYEQLGLLGPSERTGTGFRYYTEAEEERLNKITALKQLGLTLDEIREVAALYLEDATKLKGKRKVVEILKRHLTDTTDKLASLQRFRADLEANIARIEHFIEQAEREQADE